MKSGQELLVGVVIIVGIVVIAVGTLFLKGTGFGQTVTRVDVLVRDVGQLTPGNSVKFRGVSIGRVSSVAVEPDGEAVRVGMELEGEVNFTSEAVVVIAPESFFGDWQAEIHPSRARFPRFDYYEVPPGAEEGGVPVLGGYALPDVSRLTATADEISENLAVLSDRIDRAFNEETADNLRMAINNIQQVSSDIRDLVQQQAATFREVTDEVHIATEEIVAATRTARRTLDSADRLIGSGQIDSMVVNMNRVSENLEQLTGDLTEAEFDRTLAMADSAFTALQRVTGRIEAGEGTLGRLLSDTTLVARTEGAIAQLEALLADLRENPQRYVRLSIF